MTSPSRSQPLTDGEIMSAATRAADALDATRVSEMRGGKWHATTIFDGDSGLLRYGRLVEKAVLAKLAALPSETAFTPPTDAEVAAYRDLFRSELDKNMHNSSGSPSTNAHRVALHRFVAGRNK